MFRLHLDGDLRPGTLTLVFDLTELNSDGARAPPADWTDDQTINVAGATADAVRTGTDADGNPTVTALSGRSVGRDWINNRKYIEVRFSPTNGYAIDPASINGGEVVLTGPNGTVALGAPVRVGTSDIWRFSFTGNLVAGAYTISFVAGSFRDTNGTANQAETEAFYVAAPSSGLTNPTDGQKLTTVDFNSRGWIDVTFAGAKPESVLDDLAEFTITSSSDETIILVGKPVRLNGGDTYRYFIVGYTSGTLSLEYVTNGWTDSLDEQQSTGVEEDLDQIDDILERTWIDVRLTPGSGTINLDSVTGDELAAISGLTAADIAVLQVGDTTFRYLFTGDLGVGTVNVTVKAGTWSDTDGNLGTASTSGFTLIEPAKVFYIDISGGLILTLPGLPAPLLELVANVSFEIDPDNAVFTLTFDGQLKLIELGTVGSTSGRFVLDMGDGTSSTPGFWGVATLETNFSKLEKYGIYLAAKGALQVNTTGVTKTETMTLKGIGDNGADVTRTFELAPGSFGLELAGVHAHPPARR